MDLLGTIIGGLAAAVVIGFFRRRAMQKRQLLQAERQIAVPTSFRLLTGGLKGRWRQGAIENRPAGCVWRPRPTRPGRAIQLKVTTVHGRRQIEGLERWWVSGNCDVLQLEGDIGAFEIAVIKPERHLVETMLGIALD